MTSKSWVLLWCLFLLSCQNSLSTKGSTATASLSTPVKYSLVSPSDSTLQITQDTLIIHSREIRGVKGGNMPFFGIPSIGSLVCSVGDTLYVKIDSVPTGGEWKCCFPSLVDESSLIIAIDSLPIDAQYKAIVYRVIAKSPQSGVIGCEGSGGYPPLDPTECYYANLNLTVGLVDSLYFETDSIVWIRHELPKESAVTRLVLRGRTNAHRVEVYTGGFGMGDTEPLTIENGEFHDTLDLYMSTDMDDYCKTTLFIFGTQNGYEKVGISTVD